MSARNHFCYCFLSQIGFEILSLYYKNVSFLSSTASLKQNTVRGLAFYLKNAAQFGFLYHCVVASLVFC